MNDEVKDEVKKEKLSVATKSLDRRIATLTKLKGKAQEQADKKIARYEAEIADVERAKAALTVR